MKEKFEQVVSDEKKYEAMTVEEKIKDRIDSMLLKLEEYVKVVKNLEKEKAMCQDSECRDIFDNLIDNNSKVIDIFQEELRLMENPEEIIELETVEARFRIVYEIHTRSHEISVLKDLDAYAQEEFIVQNKEHEKISQEAKGLVDRSIYAGSDDIIHEALEDSSKNLYSCDLGGNYLLEKITKEFKLQGRVDIYTIIAELVALGVIGTSTAFQFKNYVKNESKQSKNKTDPQNKSRAQMSRRSFLKLGLAAVSAAAILKDVSLMTSDSENAKSLNHKLAKLRQEMMDSLGFTKIAITLRNMVMAQKLFTIAEMEKENMQTKPYIGFEVGLAHSGIEKFLEMPEEERLKEIKDLIKKLNLNFEEPELEIAAIYKKEFDKVSGKWEKKMIIDEKIMGILK